MTKENEVYIEIGKNIPDAVESQMFGKPCFKINGKAFMCFFQNEIAFKLTGDSHSDALSLDATQLFDPSGKGRAMKEWVQVPFHYQDKWPEFAQEAMNYVKSKS